MCGGVDMQRLGDGSINLSSHSEKLPGFPKAQCVQTVLPSKFSSKNAYILYMFTKRNIQNVHSCTTCNILKLESALTHTSCKLDKLWYIHRMEYETGMGTDILHR